MAVAAMERDAWPAALSLLLHGAVLAGFLLLAAAPRREAETGLVVEVAFLASEATTAEPALREEPAEPDWPAPPAEVLAPPVPVASMAVEPPAPAMAPAPVPDPAAALEPPPVAAPAPRPPQAAQPSRAIAPRPPRPARASASREGNPAAAATPAIAATPAPDPGPPVILNPRFRRPPRPPEYPARAIELDLTGTVIIRALLSRDGDPKEMRLQRSSGHPMLDGAALAAVRQWAFQPGQRDGQPVEAWVEVPVHFRLN